MPKKKCEVCLEADERIRLAIYRDPQWQEVFHLTDSEAEDLAQDLVNAIAGMGPTTIKCDNTVSRQEEISEWMARD